jgi:hypothetical protein
MSYKNIPTVGVPYTYVENYIPVDGDNRPGIKEPEKWSLTVHNTGNTATDEQERNNLARENNYAEVGFHFSCDPDSVTATIPDDEVAYHSATEMGNYHSLGLEVCEIPGAEEVAAEFSADYFIVHEWEIDRLTTHQAWSGKYCPRLILPHWDKFQAKVLKLIQTKKILMKEGLAMKVVVPFGVADIGAALVLGNNLRAPVLDWGRVEATDDVIQVGGPLDAKPQAPCKSFMVISGASRLDTVDNVSAYARSAK